MSDSDKLVALLDGYHITDRALARFRDRVRSGDDRALPDLRKEMRRYFSGVRREAAAQLSGIDVKLDDLYQRQYNLQAERGVAQRRLEGAQSVLDALDAVVEEVR